MKTPATRAGVTTGNYNGRVGYRSLRGCLVAARIFSSSKPNQNGVGLDNSPALTVVNKSAVLAKDIKWTVALWNMDLQDRNDPLPLPVGTFDWIRPDNEGGPQNLFDGPLVSPLLKSGNRLFGSASVICPECARGRTYIVYIVWGEGGWFSEIENETSGKILIPPNFLKATRLEYFKALEAAAPTHLRTSIMEGTPTPLQSEKKTRKVESKKPDTPNGTTDRSVMIENYIPVGTPGLLSSVQIINIGNTPTKVTVDFLDSSTGRILASGTLPDEIQPNARKQYTAQEIESFLQVTLPSGVRPRLKVTGINAPIKTQHILINSTTGAVPRVDLREIN
jgi:hypothetical protein